MRGDFLLRELPPSLFKRCEEKGVSVSADLDLTDLRILDLLKSKLQVVNQFRITLFSLSKKQDNHLSVIDDHFSRSLKVLDFLKLNFGGSIVLLFPLLSANYQEITKVASFAFKKGIYFNPIFLPQSYNGNAIDKNEYWEVARCISKLKQKYPKKIFSDFPLAAKCYDNLHGWCPAGRLLMNINIKGEISLCPYSNNFIGSLRKFSLINYWIKCQEEAARLIANCEKRKCFKKCGGGCLTNRISKDGIDNYCPICPAS